MKIIGFIFILISLVSCSDSNWIKSDINSFVQGCREEGGSKDYCECYMESVMSEYPNYEDSQVIDFEDKIELSKNCGNE